MSPCRSDAAQRSATDWAYSNEGAVHGSFLYTMMVRYYLPGFLRQFGGISIRPVGTWSSHLQTPDYNHCDEL